MPPGIVPYPFGECRICKDKATGLHYGVNTCEGCKGFFKRSLLKGNKYKCFFGGQCKLSPQNRNRCKACRFQRCLNVGMSMEAVKMGRIPKVDKERALEEQRHSGLPAGVVFPETEFACSSDRSGCLYRDTHRKPTSHQSHPIMHYPGPQSGTIPSLLTTPWPGCQVSKPCLPVRQQASETILPPTVTSLGPSQYHVPQLTQHPNLPSQTDLTSFAPFANSNVPLAMDVDQHDANSDLLHVDAIQATTQAMKQGIDHQSAHERHSLPEEMFSSVQRQQANIQGDRVSRRHAEEHRMDTANVTCASSSSDESNQSMNSTAYKTDVIKQLINQVIESNTDNAGLKSCLHRALQMTSREVSDNSEENNTDIQELFKHIEIEQGQEDHNAKNVEVQVTLRRRHMQNSLRDSLSSDNDGRNSESASSHCTDSNSEQQSLSSHSSDICQESSSSSSFENTETDISDKKSPSSDHLCMIEDTIRKLQVVADNDLKDVQEQEEIMKQEISGRRKRHKMNLLTESTAEQRFTTWRNLFAAIPESNARILSMSKNVPGFKSLDVNDQSQLIKEAYFDIWLIHMSKLFSEHETYSRLQFKTSDDSYYYSYWWMLHFLPLKIIRNMQTFWERLSSVNPSWLVIVVLSAIRLTLPSHIQSENQEQIEVLHSHYKDVLAHVIKESHGNNAGVILLSIFKTMSTMNHISALNLEVVGNFKPDCPPDCFDENMACIQAELSALQDISEVPVTELEPTLHIDIDQLLGNG